MTLISLAFGHYTTGRFSDPLRTLLANSQESLSYALLLTVVVAKVISAVRSATGATRGPRTSTERPTKIA